VEELIQGYVDCLAKQNASRSYLNTIIKRLRTFFHVNGYTDLKLHRYYQPTRYRRRDEYIPTKAEVHAMANASGSNRDRAIVLVLWSSGLRVSTFCALNYGDVSGEPYEHGESCVLLPVYPEMKTRVPAACKGEIPYYTFICPDALDAVKVYLLEREELYGRLEPEDPLFHSDWHLWKRSERSHRRLGRRGVGLIVKKAARRSGIKNWQLVTSHCLRKAFESVLHSPTRTGGRLDKGTQQFLFGHILPGSQDTYYDKSRIDFHRQEYAKLVFSREILPEIAVDRLIDLTELEKYLADGFLFVAKVSPNKIVVRKAH
jgi:integrase